MVGLEEVLEKALALGMESVKDGDLAGLDTTELTEKKIVASMHGYVT